MIFYQLINEMQNNFTMVTNPYHFLEKSEKALLIYLSFPLFLALKEIYLTLALTLEHEYSKCVYILVKLVTKTLPISFFLAVIDFYIVIILPILCRHTVYVHDINYK